MRIRLKDDVMTEAVGNLIVRPESSGGGGGSGQEVAEFQAIQFVTGLPIV